MDIFSSITIEGQIISAEVLSKLKQEGTAYQKPEDFGFTENQKLRDEIQFAYSQARKQWSIFKDQAERLSNDETGTSETRRYWILPLLGYLGYNPEHSTAEIVNNRSYAISHRDNDRNGFPIHIMGIHDNIDKKRDTGGPRLSPHGLVQEYLNMTEHLFGLVSNGYKLRLLRDSSRFSRLSFVEFDLQAMMEDELYSDFAVMYRLIHASRMPVKPEDSADSIIEHYHQDAIESGARIREKLRAKVEQTLQMLGNGFLNHPANKPLRQEFLNEDMDASGYYGKLLKIIYRFLFLMVIEERKLVFPKKEDIKGEWNEDQLKEYREIYEKYYSIHRLRNLAEKRHQLDADAEDLWEQLKKTFQLFEKESMGSRMGIQALNGDLFSAGALDPLDECSLKNDVLLRALDAIARFENENGQMTRVNYGALDVEEFGSVYESLLDHEPIVDQGTSSDDETGWGFRFSEGTERKTTGSYYTRPELVQELVKSALEPVIEERLEKAETDEKKVRELLALKVCDPAAGSGHFLLAAARKISDHLVVARYGQDYSLMEQRLAMREVVKHCIYGVDLNPMAVELCKVALWLESYSVGLPLTFLDHHVKNGNSLVGVDDLERLNEGIPDGAFNEVLGDVKEVARKLKKRNKKEREKGKQTELQASTGSEEIALEKFAERLDGIDAMPERSVEETTRKKLAYQSFKKSREFQQAVTAANIWTGTFFIETTEEHVSKKLIATSSGLHSYIANPKGSYPPMTAKMDAISMDQKFFHWPLEYPEVFTKGGFDVVLGNPPWERIKLQEKEFFKGKDERIANAKNKSQRGKKIKALKEENHELFKKFEKAKRDAELLTKFVKESDRYSLTAVGDINTYQLFSGLDRKLIKPSGRAGFIVPSGIATDYYTQDFFKDLVQKKSIISFYDFENSSALFEGVHRSFKFCLLTIAGTAYRFKDFEAEFAFFLKKPSELDDDIRRFKLKSEDLIKINPNTLALPIFRTKPDATITNKIYKVTPILINDREQTNPWKANVFRAFDMYHYSDEAYTHEKLELNNFPIETFIQTKEQKLFPVWESKMFNNYDHRYSSYEKVSEQDRDNGKPQQLSIEEKELKTKTLIPRYWIKEKYLDNILDKKTSRNWLIGFRNITNSTNERSCICSVLPFTATDYSVRLFLSKEEADIQTCFVANSNSIVFDYIVRQKLAGTNLSEYVFKQLPVLPPETYSKYDKSYIKERVLELTYTSHDLKPFAQSLGYIGEPFTWDEERRSQLKAELDAYYAKLYGLNREELLYILDPKAVYGEDFPGETFRVLKNKDIRKYGEYRTKRLVLEAWDRLEKGEPMMSEEKEQSIETDLVHSEKGKDHVLQFDSHTGIYSVRDAVEIINSVIKENESKLTYNKVRRWFKDLMEENYEGLSGSEKRDIDNLRISFLGLIELNVIGVLRDKKLSLKKILNARNDLASKTGRQYPFATNDVDNQLNVPGNSIVFNFGGDNIVTLDGTGQYNLHIVRKFFRDVKFNRKGIAEAIMPSTGNDIVVIRPELNGGKPAVIQKGVSVERIQRYYSGPDSRQIILKEFGLEEDELDAVLSYAQHYRN